MTRTIEVPERAVALTLLACIGALNVTNAWVLATDASRWLLLGLERNPSTWFSAAQLALAAVLAYAVGIGRDDRRNWNVVAAVLLFLSVDEVATVHEKLGQLPGIPGIGHRAWAGAGLVLAALVAWRLLPWALRLERPLRFALVVGGATFVAGAIGFEVAAAQRAHEDTTFWVLSSIEENLEMVGVYVVARLLLAQLRATGARVVVAVAPCG